MNPFESDTSQPRMILRTADANPRELLIETLVMMLRAKNYGAATRIIGVIQEIDTEAPKGGKR